MEDSILIFIAAAVVIILVVVAYPAISNLFGSVDGMINCLDNLASCAAGGL